MKVSVLQENLAQGLGIVSRAVSSRSTLPVLANILVKTEDGRLRLSATNLEIGITCWIGAKIEEEGSTTVPSRTFSDLVGTLPNAQVDMSLNTQSQNLNVNSGPSNTDIKCIDSQEFPPMPKPELDGGAEFNVKDLKEIIRQVVFSASTDDARPVLTGVLLVIEGNKLIMAAADGFRLSVREAELSQAVEAPIRAIIPARALMELARVAGDGDEIVTMLLPEGRGQVIFRMKNIELSSQLIEGNFPEYQQIIPGSHTTRTVVSTNAFLKACKQAEIFAREGSHIARVNVIPGNEMQPGTIEISAQSEETGSSEVFVDATIEGDAVLIAFNVRYLREALDVISTPNVALETTAAAAPGVLRPLSEEGFLHVIMPMHLGN
ncbi:MAG: DNA polymerase III subunit beta [Chloroflexi bacterium]|jgi:DNA polymerase III subunit beta|nr:DNA polymerase III subunit beta [Chloroflexota bacterium]MBT3671151.1 DNA polymerase III subunit beta [Chloroflexota bacterium]MBT4004260.1 DNA polymerase III subunit beta [Chloroflexota bacterium]MBT4304390.1 DNA polymerase III subunit beta [Chloroflexota bacterium]MBT4534409.1 DNA polymerase III subunit beta [Chloroflexota bacterium]